MNVDLSPEAIGARLRAVAAATDLTAERRLHPKVDYSPEAIAWRLRTVESLRRACVSLGQVRPVATR